MSDDERKLIEVLCDPTATTGEALSFMGVAALAIRVEKPSSPKRDAEEINQAEHQQMLAFG